MTTKFNITFHNGKKMTVFSNDSATVKALAISMFGTEEPNAEIVLVDEAPVKEPAKAPAKKA